MMTEREQRGSGLARVATGSGRRAVIAAWVVALLLGWQPRARSEPAAWDELPSSVFTITTNGCKEGPKKVTGRSGTAFAVKDWPGVWGGPFLVTALHVIHRCKTIEVLPAKPGGSARTPWSPRGSYYAIPALDIAVLLIPKKVLQEWNSGVAYLRFRRAQASKSRLTKLIGKDLRVWGESGGGAAAGYLPKVIQVVKVAGLVANKGGSAVGGLDRKRWLVIYGGSMAAGVSGGPVLVKEEEEDGAVRVIGMHHGGLRRDGQRWAVVLSRAELVGTWKKPQQARWVVIGAEVSGYRAPKYGHSLGRDEVDMAMRWQPRTRKLRFDVTAARRVGDVANRRGLSGEVGFDGDLPLWPDSLHTRSLAWRVDLGYRFTGAERRLLGPDGIELASDDISGHDVLGDVGLELRLRRTRRLRPSVFTGLRLGLAWHRDPDENWRFAFLWGVPVEFRLSIAPRLDSFFELAVFAGLALERAPEPTYRYTGVGADYEGHGRTWSTSAAGGISIGF